MNSTRSALIALRQAGEGSAGRAAAARWRLAAALALGCGITLRGWPGLLELRQTSGAGARNGYGAIVLTRFQGTKVSRAYDDWVRARTRTSPEGVVG